MKHLRNSAFGLVLIISQLLLAQAKTVQTPLDQSVQLNQEQVSSIFKDMVVVQRKAKEKAGKFLFNTFGSFDFSDGPVTMYGLNTNFGYAFSDFWEVYLNLVPAFMAQQKSIVSKVSSLSLDPSQCVPAGTACTARITYAKPKSQYGVEVLWIPAYGKDSWGPYSIIRSDTFFKLGIANINYFTEQTDGTNLNETGLRYTLLLGKTYFIANSFNLRVGAGTSYVQTIVDGTKKFNTVAILEAGLVFYF